MGSPMTLSYLTLGDLEKSISNSKKQTNKQTNTHTKKQDGDLIL